MVFFFCLRLEGLESLHFCWEGKENRKQITAYPKRSVTCVNHKGKPHSCSNGLLLGTVKKAFPCDLGAQKTDARISPPVPTQRRGEELPQLWICSWLLGRGESCICRTRQQMPTNGQPLFYSTKSPCLLSQGRKVNIIIEIKSSQGERKGELKAGQVK